MISDNKKTVGTVPYGLTPKDVCEDFDAGVGVVAGNAPMDDLLP